MKKVLVVALALDVSPWREIEEVGQRGTWASGDHDVPVFWLHGLTKGPARAAARIVPKALESVKAAALAKEFRRRAGAWAASRPVVTQGRRIQTQVPETYLMTNAKNVAALRHLLVTQDFDYVLRTNSSTYVNLSMLSNFVQALPSEGYYGGAVWQAKGLEFITGSTILLSRDLVEYAAFDDAWDFDLIDDMALGESMQRAGAKPQSVARVDVLTAGDIDVLRAEDLGSAFLVRCKGATDRDHDIAAMRRVHQLYETDKE